MISAKEIRDIATECFFKKEEMENGKPVVDPVIVEGIVRNYGFHPDRLKAKALRLKEIIQELNPSFYEGWSFLNLPFDKDGAQWGEQPDAEMLYCLCAGNDLAKYCFSRDMWDALPGGVPYIIFNKE